MRTKRQVHQRRRFNLRYRIEEGSNCLDLVGRRLQLSELIDHVFDGAAKIARYNFNDDGTVDFTTKFLRSNLYEVTAILV